MPWRLIFFLMILTIFIIFAGFNTHLVTVSFGFWTITNVPMFLALFLAFLAGALIILPFSIISMSKRNKRKADIQKRELRAVFNNDIDADIETAERNEDYENIDTISFKKNKRR